MMYFIDLRADSAGGNPVATVEDVVVRTDTQPNPNPSAPLDAELTQATQGRDVLLGTHGFHVNRQDGINNLAHWSEWLQLGANGLFVGVLWPGDARWVPFIDYPIEGNEAIHSGQLLAEYLAATMTGASSLSFASHSLGARLVLEAVRHLPAPLRVRTVTMMAGAIDDNCLSAEYQDSAIRIDRVSVLASRRDEVLQLAFPAGNIATGIVSRGDPYWHGALGRYGPNPPNQPAGIWPTPIQSDDWKFEHDSYINCSGPAVGPPTESGSFSPPHLVLSAADLARLSDVPNWRQAWSAGFVSARFS